MLKNNQESIALNHNLGGRDNRKGRYVPSDMLNRTKIITIIIIIYLFIFFLYYTIRHHGIRLSRFNPWIKKIPQRKSLQSTPVFASGKSHEQRSLAGYSPQGHEDTDITEATQHACTYHQALYCKNVLFLQKYSVLLSVTFYQI